ncbi:hypothetical protein PP459_gp191 [Streptomyces phage Wakanda]|uniref:Uncharacterized protein n=2 Tax=Wakandavirus TaxID=3044854 RepID=A0A6G8R3S4_9CAUD|nr:hypothetical protein PP459_gp191 [Streptomyces phage Wakanda]YP_010652362.1 hypothetical protein PP460_gp196 [Streptomyces phage Muntaha]QIN94043.1 hypothetical protein SEA_WAKANDA_50 [Streptomyces phage Wakanda]QIN94608.1 hypothetical protein SEA_MUNTAHA_51 [Streptomyces phage Muntaha]
MHEVEKPGHRVKVSIGYTRNMGDFESLRMDIGLELDGSGNPNPTFDKAYNWAEGKLLEKIAEVEEEIRSTKKSGRK